MNSGLCGSLEKPRAADWIRSQTPFSTSDKIEASVSERVINTLLGSKRASAVLFLQSES